MSTVPEADPFPPAEAAVDPARLVFVGGLHRSGTTPLARTLALHPEISGLADTGVKEDEGQHLQSVYPKAKTYGGAGRFAMDPRAHLTEDSPLVTPANAATMVREWSRHWDTSRRLLLEKSPPNLVMSRFLLALYPGSAFIAVVRHPIVVALSTHKWRRLIKRDLRLHTTHYALVEHWVRAHETFLADVPHLGRLHVLRYERLVADPESELAPVADLLGLSSPLDSGSLKASHSNRYEQRWDEMASGGLLDRRNRRLIERDFGQVIERWGYDCDDLSALPTGPALPV